jgi:2-oxoisovalerate dehydrogenase E1 component alpha subunit
MTYRVGHHSTSDDASRYRANSEVDEMKKSNSPTTRLRKYLESKGLWDESREKETWARSRTAVLEALKKAETQLKPAVSELWNDVYDELTWPLKEQKRELEEHLAKWSSEYPMSSHAK